MRGLFNLGAKSAAIAIAVLGLPVYSTVASAAPPVLPEPTYNSVSKEVLIPMDDGVRIAATVAIPSEDGATPLPGPFPVVLGMTPYGRNAVCGCYPPDFWAGRGMVGVVADVRGTGGSGGDLGGNYFSPREARDGAALVEHFGTEPYSSGKVGMAGGSYVGITQYLTAEQRPPHLAAIVPQVAISDLYRDGFTHGGVQNLSFDLQYIGVQGVPGVVGTNTDPTLLGESLAAKLGQSPPGAIAFDYLARPNDDQFYRDRSPIYGASEIEVPVLDIGEWRDGLLRGETEMYQALAQRPGVETRLYMGPCTHKGCGAPFAPTVDPPGRYDEAALAFEFLQKHLLGVDTPERPPVEYYLQSRNEVVGADSWPLPNTGYERLELGPGSLGPPDGAAAGTTRQYVSNPTAGLSMALDQYGTVAVTPYLPLDQRLEGGQGLTFRTAALDAPLDLVGPISLHLVAASSATDTDWFAKLADVAPDGSESIITAGALRASHRALDPAESTPLRPYHTHTDPQPIEPNAFYEYEIEIWPTAYELAPGHRLQLRVTSSDLPTHFSGSILIDRDRSQDLRIEPFLAATNTVALGESFLRLPAPGSGAGDALAISGTAGEPPPAQTRRKKCRKRGSRKRGSRERRGHKRPKCHRPRRGSRRGPR